jgi:hypothetical protein
MLGSHYSDKPRKESGVSWEEQTFRLLKEVARQRVAKFAGLTQTCSTIV